MVETVTAPEWVGELEGFEAGDIEVLSRYDSSDAALKGIAQKDKKISSSLRFPDDKTSDDDRAKFDAQVHEYRGVPKTDAEYEIEHPELPEGMTHNAEFENRIRVIAKEHNVSQKALAALSKEFSDTRINGHKAISDAAKTCMDNYTKEMGQSVANEVLGYKDEKGEQVMGTSKRGFMGLSTELEFDYVDDHNSAQSKLIDSIERIHPTGCLGNDPVMIKIGQWLWETKYKEGTTPPAGAPEGSGGTEVFSPAFYKKTDDGKDT